MDDYISFLHVPATTLYRRWLHEKTRSALSCQTGVLQRVMTTRKQSDACLLYIWGKAGGDAWRSMSDEDKAEFVTIAEQRKKDYDKKMKAYENKQAAEIKEDESDKSKSEVADEDEGSDEEEDDD